MSSILTEIIDSAVVIQTTSREVFIGVGMSTSSVCGEYTALQYTIQIDNTSKQARTILNVSDIGREVLIKSSSIYTITRPNSDTLQQYLQVVRHYLSPPADPNVYYVDSVQ